LKEYTIEITINVRFSESDAMGVVWHGNYLKYFEDAREAFSNKYALTYKDVYNNGFFTPIVKSEINYKAPIFYGESIKVIAKYFPVAAAKIIFEYQIINLSTGKICATGKTIQVFLNAANRTLELNKPPFYEVWERETGIKTK
jgi:acyl-CoA thioester hydrolase